MGQNARNKEKSQIRQKEKKRNKEKSQIRQNY